MGDRYVAAKSYHALTLVPSWVCHPLVTWLDGRENPEDQMPARGGYPVVDHD